MTGPELHRGDEYAPAEQLLALHASAHDWLQRHGEYERDGNLEQLVAYIPSETVRRVAPLADVTLNLGDAIGISYTPAWQDRVEDEQVRQPEQTQIYIPKHPNSPYESESLFIELEGEAVTSSRVKELRPEYRPSPKS